ncbi:hypothetical protein C8R45DRAFT_1107302 [Mycena sanguinolenta]|nr:hypothetical protein C8R45DRAFT_1107302 [Mycena sanguinolenta]
MAFQAHAEPEYTAVPSTSSAGSTVAFFLHASRFEIHGGVFTNNIYTHPAGHTAQTSEGFHTILPGDINLIQEFRGMCLCETGAIPLGGQYGFSLASLVGGRADEENLHVFHGAGFTPHILADVLSANGSYLRLLVVKEGPENVEPLSFCIRLERFECNTLPSDALVAVIP